MLRGFHSRKESVGDPAYVEKSEKVYGAEISVERRRCTDLGADCEVGTQQLGNFCLLVIGEFGKSGIGVEAVVRLGCCEQFLGREETLQLVVDSRADRLTAGVH